MTRARSIWEHGVKTGVIGGVAALLIVLVGMAESFNRRDIIADVVTMGQVLLLILFVLMGYIAAKRTTREDTASRCLNTVVGSLVTAGFLALLVIVGHLVNLRAVLVNASPVLYRFLTLGHKGAAGIFIILLIGIVCGVFAAVLYHLPPLTRRTIVISLSSMIMAGVLQDLIRPILAAWGPMAVINDWLFTGNGLTVIGSVSFAILIAGTMTVWSLKKQDIKAGYVNLSDGSRRGIKVGGYFTLAIVLIALPHVLGLFLSEVLTIVGLYVLLGLGLNIVVGYAGMLDLGYVAFFAIGSYVTAILTSPELGFFNFTFWGALPFAIVIGVISGVLLGTPVLKMRGDYLAIATLGFGEIIRILVLSDFLRPWLGGAQGAGGIPKAIFFGYQLVTPQRIYYLILAGCILVVFISLRLKHSRMGRAWMAMREDEDVAQAMGINLVSTKLMAFAIGAGFSALSGAIFASKLGSVYPHSFSVMISINIICLIIVGGMGSIPGVIVGAAALVGLPELLREFAEFRMLVYGAALVAMMLLRPEGLWPEAKHKMELHAEEGSVGEPELSAAT
ncbi:MAG: leucine/isoleucine/valine transporter permease subunit [Pseudomonadota bacterium]